MKIYSIICTRDKNLNPITKKLVHTLSSFGIEIKLLVNQKSIFEAYKRGMEACSPKDGDIIICCHDDLSILSTKQEFIAGIAKCINSDSGFVGPAGTTLLGQDSVWWDQTRWQAGYHRGVVKHHDKDTNTIHRTSYGPYGQVVALDGLFLAARKEVWEDVGVEKPEYFEGDWDFYDIHYTTTAHQKGYKNYSIPIDLIHYSKGELVGRDSWHKNREAFINNTKLPMSC